MRPIGPIHVEELSSCRLEPLYNDLSYSFHKLIAKNVVFFGFVTQVHSIHDNDLRRFNYPCTELPAVRREEPRPAQDITSCNCLDSDLTTLSSKRLERDFAFVVDKDVEALTLVNAAAGADKALIEDVRVFDEFIGGALGEDKKSIAVTVRLQPTGKTLKEADIEAVAGKIVEKVEKATGGSLRG